MLTNSVLPFPGMAHLLFHWKPLKTVLNRHLRSLVVVYQTGLDGEGSELCVQFALAERLVYYRHCLELLVHGNSKKQPNFRVVSLLFLNATQTTHSLIKCHPYQTAPTPSCVWLCSKHLQNDQLLLKNTQQSFKILILKHTFYPVVKKCQCLQDKEPSTLCAQAIAGILVWTEQCRTCLHWLLCPSLFLLCRHQWNTDTNHFSKVESKNIHVAP